MGITNKRKPLVNSCSKHVHQSVHSMFPSLRMIPFVSTYMVSSSALLAIDITSSFVTFECDLCSFHLFAHNLKAIDSA